MISKYKKKPVVIEAIKLTEKSIKEVYEFVHGYKVELKNLIEFDYWELYEKTVVKEGMNIPTLEDGFDKRAKHVASMGDYVIKGIKGEFYACKPDIFQATYEAIGGEHV